MKSATLKKIVLIGASTGGPGQIQKIITALPILKDSSVIVAQHMVQGFLESFASRLQYNTKNKVTIIKDKQALNTSTVYVAEGITKIDPYTLIFTSTKASQNTYNPDIDTLFQSFIPLCKDVEILSVILTGIGSDGVDACVNLHKEGVTCITETEDSAIVDGMPNRARAFVPNIKIHNINEIIKIISEFCDV